MRKLFLVSCLSRFSAAVEAFQKNFLSLARPLHSTREMIAAVFGPNLWGLGKAHIGHIRSIEIRSRGLFPLSLARLTS